MIFYLCFTIVYYWVRHDPTYVNRKFSNLSWHRNIENKTLSCWATRVFCGHGFCFRIYVTQHASTSVNVNFHWCLTIFYLFQQTTYDTTNNQTPTYLQHWPAISIFPLAHPRLWPKIPSLTDSGIDCPAIKHRIPEGPRLFVVLVFERTLLVRFVQ